MRTARHFIRMILTAFALFSLQSAVVEFVIAGPDSTSAPFQRTFPTHKPVSAPSTLQGASCLPRPILVAEGSNSCEIISCGMTLKDTCKITCPADKTPKCSCDCTRSFGPICTDYKANCRCE